MQPEDLIGNRCRRDAVPPGSLQHPFPIAPSRESRRPPAPEAAEAGPLRRKSRKPRWGLQVLEPGLCSGGGPLVDVTLPHHHMRGGASYGHSPSQVRARFSSSTKFGSSRASLTILPPFATSCKRTVTARLLRISISTVPRIMVRCLQIAHHPIQSRASLRLTFAGFSRVPAPPARNNGRRRPASVRAA